MTDQDQPWNMELHDDYDCLFTVALKTPYIWSPLIETVQNSPTVSPMANIKHDFNILYCLISSHTLTLTWLIIELYTGTWVLHSGPIHVPCTNCKVPHYGVFSNLQLHWNPYLMNLWRRNFSYIKLRFPEWRLWTITSRHHLLIVGTVNIMIN
jgi:hypothetical protein